MKKWIFTYMIMTSVLVALLTTVSSAQVISGFYELRLLDDGTISSGYGDGYQSNQIIWHYYPSSNRYIMWFHSTGYEPNRVGDFNLTAFIESRTPANPLTYDISYGWTKPTWVNASRPPMPLTDVATLSDENAYFSTKGAKSQTKANYKLDAGEYAHITRNYLIQDYHPEWVYVSISGTNVAINQTVTIENIESVPHAIGACCNTATGNCFLTDTGSCLVPDYIYLGDGTDCSDCQIQNFTWDFGDAPSSYQVTKASNGAQHTIQTGMYLGIGMDPDLDGQPSANADADAWDDGVAFNSQITSGQSTSVTVTASTLGVINAWLDLNQDGDWGDIGEHILADEPIIQGQNTLSFYVPITATAGQSYARFRYNSSGGIGYTGLAPDGEVEDYAVFLLSGSNPDPDPNPDPEPNPNPGIAPVSPSNLFASKWNQPVDLLDSSYNLVYGWNLVTRQDAIPLIADDWFSGGALPIQGFRWWGAFDNWLMGEMPADLPYGFHFGIWSNNPTQDKPGTLIWEHTVNNWVWAYTGQVQDAQGQIGGESVFEFTSLISQDKWFYPSASPNTIYWLSIAPIYSNNVLSATPWGWMTRQTNGTLPAERILSIYNPGQWPPALGTTYAAGSPVTYPSSTQWDVAFELITSQPGGGSSSNNSDLAEAIGDLNDDGTIDINDLYILLGFVLGV